MLKSLFNKLTTFVDSVSPLDTTVVRPVPEIPALPDPEEKGLQPAVNAPEMPAVKKERKPRVKKEQPVKAKATKPKLTEKEIANKRKEPWVDVISFNVNKENIRNGFYELDWNDHFIEKLRYEGYGYDGDPEDEIVSRWFRDICLNAAAAEGVEIDESMIGTLDIAAVKK